jgi:hypothetical protein
LARSFGNPKLIEWARLSFVERQRGLIFRPINDFEEHATPEHFLFEIGGIFSIPVFLERGIGRLRTSERFPYLGLFTVGK